MAETLVEYRDVTGAMIQFSQEQIVSLMHAMPEEQRQFARVLAETITKPHEIWQVWVPDEADIGQWCKLRSYLQFLDLSQADDGAPYGVAIAQFVADNSRWKLISTGMVVGTQEIVMEKIDAKVRQGSLEYSIQQH